MALTNLGPALGSVHPLLLCHYMKKKLVLKWHAQANEVL